MNVEQFLPGDVAAALELCGGRVFETAELLGCCHRTVYAYLHKYEECRVAKRRPEGRLLDLAEDQLARAIRRGEEWAVKFLLRSKGKHRGYAEVLKPGTPGERISADERLAGLNQLLDTARERRMGLSEPFGPTTNGN